MISGQNVSDHETNGLVVHGSLRLIFYDHVITFYVLLSAVKRLILTLSSHVPFQTFVVGG